MNPKIKGPRQLAIILRSLRKKRRTIVTTNGCFDILHMGHVSYLQKAKKLGHVLIVAVNSDETVRKLKGKSRPVNDELSRAEVLAALQCVDIVTIFKDDNPVRFVKFVRPSVHVKASDYKVDEVIEYEAVKSCGGKLALMDYIDGFSTTNMLKKVKDDIGNHNSV